MAVHASTKTSERGFEGGVSVGRGILETPLKNRKREGEGEAEKCIQKSADTLSSSVPSEARHSTYTHLDTHFSRILFASSGAVARSAPRRFCVLGKHV